MYTNQYMKPPTKTKEPAMAMIMRFDPYRELDRSRGEMPGWRSPSNTSRVIPMDAYRHGDRFVVRLDLPGIDPAGIEVTVERNTLRFTAERSWSPEPGDKMVLAERPQGKLSRQLFLGEGLDTEAVDATYVAGVLTVTLPVAESAKPRKVSVIAPGGHDEPMGAEPTHAEPTHAEPAQAEPAQAEPTAA